MSMQFNEEKFNEEVIEASKQKPVLVDFFASWCGPCKIQGPIIDQLADEVKGKAVVGKFDIESGQNIASQFEVMSIPTIILFKDGQVKEKLIGLQSKDFLLELIGKYQ